jgi:hypothetical protein
MSHLDVLVAALTPVVDRLRRLNAASLTREELEAELPIDSPEVVRIRQLVREGVRAGWLADRENDGIRFGRIRKAADENDVSIDVVHMAKPGLGHTHPHGEIDLCFAVSGSPRFDGYPEGWVVYRPGSWHVPTVDGGVMDILYFLPGGAIRFEAQPSAAGHPNQ